MEIARVHTGNEFCSADFTVKHRFSTQQFGYDYFRFDGPSRVGINNDLLALDIFRTDAEDQFFTVVAFVFQHSAFSGRQGQFKPFAVRDDAILQSNVEEVHGRRSDESSYENVNRCIVNFFRAADLLHKSILHDDDAVCHGHRFGLVMGYVDGCRIQATVQFCDFSTHGHTQFCIQV